MYKISPKAAFTFEGILFSDELITCLKLNIQLFFDCCYNGIYIFVR